MNNYISIELTEFDSKMGGYLMLFNYRMCNHCVKAEPTAMLPVSVMLGGQDYDLEKVADTLRPDEYTFDVYPKNPNNLDAIVKGVFEMHPEFKMEIKTDKTDSGELLSHIVYTMPEVNEERRDLLNETTKTFHRECLANFDACYAKEQATIAELFVQLKLPVSEVEEAETAFKSLYDESKEQAGKLLDAKLAEIEEGYQRYLANQEQAESETDNMGYSTSMRIGQVD